MTGELPAASLHGLRPEFIHQLTNEFRMMLGNDILAMRYGEYLTDPTVERDELIDACIQMTTIFF